MPTFIPLGLPSALLRQQVKNISSRMRYIVGTTVLHPLRSMIGFNKVEANFDAAEREAYLCCSVMDQSQSIESSDRATNATHAVMTELIDLKSEASDLVENEATGTEKPWRF